MLNPLDKDGLYQVYKIYSKASLRDALSLKSREQAKQFSWSKHSTDNCCLQTFFVISYAVTFKFFKEVSSWKKGYNILSK